MDIPRIGLTPDANPCAMTDMTEMTVIVPCTVTDDVD